MTTDIKALVKSAFAKGDAAVQVASGTEFDLGHGLTGTVVMGKADKPFVAVSGAILRDKGYRDIWIPFPVALVGAKLQAALEEAAK